MTDDVSSGAPSDPGPDPPSPSSTPSERYTRLGLLGRGGMGQVFAAQDAQLRRQVALKVAATPQLAGRLAREAWITAQLEHPNIVAVYDAGETDGQAWYTMRIIRGRTLRERLADCADLPARLELLPHLHAACQAVAYAHSMGVVHRDLKPANIMVGAFGETQVADWGLAVPLAEAEADWARVVGGGAVGTLRYMSPEAKEGAAPTRAVDVYALGAALWELLAGTPPPEGPLHEAALPPTVPPELAAIVRCAVNPTPAQRYQDAGQLAADLGRWLAGGRVRAHEYRPIELLGRVVRAWRAPLTVAGVALALGMVAAGVGIRRLAQERRVAEANLSAALEEAARTALMDERQPEAHQLAAHALLLGPSPEARGILAATSPRGVQLRASIPLPVACRRVGVLSPDGTRLACPTATGVELWDVAPLARRAVLEGVVARTPVWVGEALLLPTADGLTWVRGDELGSRVPVTSPWTPLASERQAFAVRGPEAIALSPDGVVVPFRVCPASPVAFGVRESRLVVGCNDGVVRQWGPDGVLVSAAALPEPPDWTAMVPSPTGLWVGAVDGEVREVDPTTGRVGAALRGAAVRALLAVPGTPVVLVLGERGGPRLWNTAAGVWAGALPAGASRMFPGTAPGEVLLLGDTLDRWFVPSQPQPHVLSFPNGVSQVSPSPDGTAVAVALGGGTVVERRRADGVELRQWTLGAAVVKGVAYAGPERLLAGEMGASGQWLLAAGETAPVPGLGMVKRVGGLTGGRAWVLGYSGDVWVRDAAGAAGPEAKGPSGVDGSSSPSGDTAVVMDVAGHLQRLDGARWVPVGEAPDAVAVDIGDGGRPLVVARLREVCVDTRCHPVPDDVVDVAVYGPRVAVGLLGGDVLVLDAATGATRAVLRGHSARVSSVEFGPGGDWLVSGSWDATVRIWDLAGLETPAADVAALGEAAWGLGLEAARRGR